MSVRRPAPLVAQHQALSVGALADRLPGSTRLSQVLAAGAKHLAKHKSVDTEAPGKRALPGLDIGFRTSIVNPLIAGYVNMLKKKVKEFLAAEAMGQISVGALQNLAQEIHSIVARIVQKANSIEDMEVLRRMHAYFVLNWLYQHGTPQQSSNAQLVLSEDLHGSNDDQFNGILGDEQHDGHVNELGLHQGVNVLGLADGPALALAHPNRGGAILNGPGPSDFAAAWKAEQRQKVEDEREAKRQKKKTQEVSPELEAQVEAAQNAQIVPILSEDQAANEQADADQAAQGDNLGGAVGGSGDYDEIRGASDDEEDNFEGDPLAQQVDKTRKK